MKHNCQIAITSSAFIILLYHLSVPNSDDLKLPFSIKIITNETGRTYFIDIKGRPLWPDLGSLQIWQRLTSKISLKV